MPLIQEEDTRAQSFQSEDQGGGAIPLSSGGAAATDGGSTPGAIQAETTTPKFSTHEENRAFLLGISPDIPSQISNIRERLGKEQERFRGAVGEIPTYESTKAQDILGRAIAPGTDEKERETAFTQAGGLLDPNDYAGPTSLNPEILGGLLNDTNTARAKSEALATPGGYSSLLGMQNPGLTAGEARFETQRRFAENPMAGREFLPESTGIYKVQSDIRQANTQAQELANQRIAAEESIANLSRQFLQGQRDPILNKVEGEVSQRNEREAQQEALFKKALESGTSEDLLALQGLSETDLNQFNTPEAALAKEAKYAYDQILKKYAEQNPWMKDIPPLVRNVTKRGESWYGVADPETGKVTDIRKIPGWTKAQERALRARQTELEREFRPRYENQKSKDPQGQYADVMPLYYGENLDPAENLFRAPDYQSYLDFKEGTQATRENLADQGEKDVINRVNQLLDEADRVGEAGEPWRAALVMADADKYLAEVEKEMQARIEMGDEGARRYVKKVRRARAAWKKQLSNRTQGLILDFAVPDPFGSAPVLGGAEVARGKRAV